MFDMERPILPSAQDTHQSSFAAPTYKLLVIPISATTHAVAQQLTYTTPPSLPTPIALQPLRLQVCPPYWPAGFNALDGREVCVECAMCDQEMADVDVTSPGMWDHESNVHYLDLCRHEIEEVEERVHMRTSNSRTQLNLWLSINPHELQACQQTIDLYSKPRLCSLRLRLSPAQGGLARVLSAADEGVMRLKALHASRRSASGPNPIPIGQIVVDGTAHNHQSQGREVTLLKNSMIVEHVDVCKEEKEH
ncbi:hypothetical protein M0805_005743 [Coniferiporia weirii]|nr:hypothetical protein M0805_005743 [Coniferiporia weirii]